MKTIDAYIKGLPLILLQLIISYVFSFITGDIGVPINVIFNRIFFLRVANDYTFFFHSMSLQEPWFLKDLSGRDTPV